MKPWIVVIGTLVVAAAAHAGNYPQPKPQDIARPFKGKPVSPGWHGRWRVTGGLDDGVVWRIYPAKSKACRSVTGGRASCFILRPPGYVDEWAGAVTLKGPRVVFRMTYRPRPNTLGCFQDDAYSYRKSARRISILKGGKHSCFWEPSAHFPILLKRID